MVWRSWLTWKSHRKRTPDQSLQPWVLLYKCGGARLALQLGTVVTIAVGIQRLKRLNISIACCWCYNICCGEFWKLRLKISQCYFFLPPLMLEFSPLPLRPWTNILQFHQNHNVSITTNDNYNIFSTKKFGIQRNSSPNWVSQLHQGQWLPLMLLEAYG
jgi:hypothetical protein